MKVKLAASMLVCFNANRQSNELPANAIIAKSVRMKSRVGFTAFCRAMWNAPARGTHSRIFPITEVRLPELLRAEGKGTVARFFSPPASPFLDGKQADSAWRRSRTKISKFRLDLEGPRGAICELKQTSIEKDYAHEHHDEDPQRPRRFSGPQGSDLQSYPAVAGEDLQCEPFADEAWASRVKDQGQTSACTGFALASLVEALVPKHRARAKSGTKTPHPSRRSCSIFSRESTTRSRAMLSMRDPQPAAQ